MKKKILTIFLTITMICTMLAGLSITASAAQTSTETWTKLTTAHTNQWLGANGKTYYYYVTEDTTLTAKTAGYSGIGIRGTVYIYVPLGVKLTLNGAAGNGTTGAAGNAGKSVYDGGSGWRYNHTAGGGGGGAGGGSGSAANNIGTGGAGGYALYRSTTDGYYYTHANGGKGGDGNKKGVDGTGQNSRTLYRYSDNATYTALDLDCNYVSKNVGSGGAKGDASTSKSALNGSLSHYIDYYTDTSDEYASKVKYVTYTVSSNTKVTLCDKLKDGVTDIPAGHSWQLEVYGKSCGASESEFAKENSKLYAPGSEITLSNVYGNMRFNLVPHTYTISYDANGGENAPDNTAATYDENVILAAAPNRTGYTFAGWNTKQDGTGINYQAGATVSNLTSENGATVTLYAQWTANTYNVTLSNLEDAECEALSSYTYGEGAKLPTPTKAGYNFTGWYDNADFEGNPVTEISATDTGDKEFYAKWEIDAEIKDSSDTVDFPKVQSKITGDTAVMRFMWQVNFADGAKIDDIGAYIIPWGLFYNNNSSLDGLSKGIVKYENPEITSGDTFTADLTDIPKMAGEHNVFNEMEISAFPFINGKLLGNFITSTVNEANIDK